MIIGGVTVTLTRGAWRWISGAGVDADGSPVAYAPIGSGLVGLDYLANAGTTGRWYGLACSSSGVPYVQQEDDPNPGYYISPTSLQDKRYGQRDPRRYVDSGLVPYIAVPKDLLAVGVKLGDVCLVSYGNQSTAAVVADVGPRGKIGEVSIRCVQLLGVDPFRGLPRHKLSGIDGGVSYAVYVGSSQGWPRSQENVDAQVAKLSAASVFVE